MRAYFETTALLLSPHSKHSVFDLVEAILLLGHYRLYGSLFYMSVPVIRDEKELWRCGVCRARIPSDKIPLQKWAKELSQVTPLNMAVEDGEYAFYRNIMEETDFPFNAILQSDIGKAIARHFCPCEEIRLDDAFCIHYNMEQDDTAGAKHTDPSDITVNMCLEKTADTQGSEVLFYGTHSLNGEDADPTIEKFLVEQEPGFATIHWGAHPHETMALRSGSRTNIVFTYCYRDSNQSQAHKRTCYS
jgi:hypothetical protein